MAGKRHDDGRVCLCDRPDGTCAGLAVQRLSRDRVRDLAEEIWTASSGLLPTVRPDGDPRPRRPLPGGAAPPETARGHRVAAPVQLPDVVLDGPTTQPTDLERATSRLLDVLRPAA